MKRLFAVGLFALLTITSGVNALAEEKTENPLADSPTQYSADMVVTRKVGTPMTMRLSVDGNKRRTEQDANGGTVVIVRGDLSKRYVLTVTSKTYVETPLDPRMVESPSDWAKRLGIVHEKVGTEDVNGEPCDKYRYTMDLGKAQNPANSKVMPRVPRPVSGFIWVSQSTHILVKSENQGSTAEWKNVKVGPPDASLFEIPADYKKQERPMLAPHQPGLQTPAEQKSGEEKSNDQKPAEQKSGGENPDGQKSYGEKSGGDKQE
jgi:hypothetical protein